MVIPVRILLGIVGVVFLAAGAMEVRSGARAPGALGRGYFPRRGPRASEGWRSRRWRVNGVVLIVWAAALFCPALFGWDMTTVGLALALGWFGYGIGLWAQLSKF